MKKIILILSLTLFIASQSFAATITVLNNNDSGAGSLRDAVSTALAGDLIIFDASLSGQTITLTSGDININKNLTIDGSALFNQISISGNNTSRIFRITGNRSVTIDALTFINGNGGNGGVILVNTGNIIVINNSTFDNNNATFEAGAIRLNANTATFSGCTFSNNTSGTFGSAISVIGGTILTIENTTISGNRSISNSGTIWANGSISLTINHTTIANNSGRGLLVYNAASNSIINNSIIANNTIADVLFTASATLTSTTNSLCKSCSGLGFAIEGQDPMLNVLANNGGPTQTRSLQTGSPAVNGGAASSLLNDQRGVGFPRSLNGTPDMGAFESSFPIVASLSPTDNDTGVYVHNNLVISFDEPIMKGLAGTIDIYDAGGVLFESIPVGDPKITVSGTTVSIDPSNPLTESTDYYVLISTAAFKDMVGNDFAGITDPTVWNFKTGPIPVPTMGQWGLIILSLLLLSLVMVSVRSKKLSLAGAGTSTSFSLTKLPLERGLFVKMVGIASLGILAIFSVAIVLFGYELTSADIPGSLMTIPLLAYLLHLIKSDDQA